MFLQRRFIVAQRGPGTQLPGQLLHGIAHHVAPGERSYRFQPAIQKQCSQHCFHGVGEHGALAPQAAAVFPAAEPHMIPQANGRGYLRHMLPADQLGADTGQLAFLPLRVHEEQGLAHDQAKYRVAQKLHALVVAGRRHPIRSVIQSLLVGKRPVR